MGASLRRVLSQPPEAGEREKEERGSGYWLGWHRKDKIKWWVIE
jgi:hypothetical protein